MFVPSLRRIALVFAVTSVGCFLRSGGGDGNEEGSGGGGRGFPLPVPEGVFAPIGDVAGFDPTVARIGSGGGDGISHTVGHSGLPDVAYDTAAGMLYVAWRVHGSEIYLLRRNGSAWEELDGSATAGGVSNTPNGSDEPSLALDNNGNPVVAWEGSVSGAFQIGVRRHNGTTWASLDVTPGRGSSDTDGDSQQPAVAVDPNTDEVLLAWVEDDQAVIMKRYRGGAWIEEGPSAGVVPGISQTGGPISRVSLALASDGTPYVAWSDESTGEWEIYVRRFDGTSWVEVGPNSATAGGVSNTSAESRQPDIVIDEADLPVLAWEQADPSSTNIYVRRFDGSAWIEPFPGSATTGGVSSDNGSDWPRLAVASDGRLFVSWSDAHIFVSELTPAGWVRVGAGNDRFDLSRRVGADVHPALAIGNNGHPIAVWEGYGGIDQVYARYFDGTAWREYDAPTDTGLSSTESESRDASVAMTPDGRPVVAWSDNVSGVFQIYALVFDGNAWTEIAGSATGPGLSDTSGDSWQPQIAVTSDDRYYVMWREVTPDNSAVFIKEYSDARWHEVTTGSATGSGVSGSSYSEEPSMRLTSEDRPVISYRAGGRGAVATFNGQDWVGFGGSDTDPDVFALSNASIVFFTLGLDDNDWPMVAWHDHTLESTGQVLFKRWNGAEWEGPGGSGIDYGISQASGVESVPSAIIQTALGPIVAWYDFSSRDLRLKRWELGSWRAVGTQTTGQLSNSDQESRYASATRLPNGDVLMAWQENGAGDNGEVWVWRYREGSPVWEPFAGTGEAGVSNSGVTSEKPSIASAANNTCVAWSEVTAPPISQIFVRCTTSE